MSAFRSIRPQIGTMLTLAVAGCGAVLAAALVLSLPQKIARGERGQIAIQALDAMRRPFLEVKAKESELLRSPGDGEAGQVLLLAMDNARGHLADYDRLTRYNPALSKKVADLFQAFESWSVSERQLIESVPAQETRAAALPASDFLNTMNRLGDGEAPIHADIDRGRAAYHVLLALLAGLLLYIVALALAQQRLAVAEAGQERAKFAAIVAAIDSGISVQDRDFRVLYQNDTLQRLIGNHLGERCFQAYAKSATVCNECPMQVVFDAGGIHRMEKWGEVNGALHHLEITASPVRDAHGGIVAALESVRDTTDRKRAEEALRTAKESAEAANKAKGQFLANVTHELKTPLHSVLGYTELLLDGIDGALNELQMDSLGKIERNARRLLRMIDELLDLSTRGIIHVDLACDRFSLRDLLNEVVETLRLSAKQKALQLNLSVAPNLPDDFIGDSNRLRQILLNVGGNAIKFTERGEVAMDVRQERCPGDGAELHFGIRDTGIGIPLVYQERIFEAFFQVDGTATRRHEGAGLGLAISSQLVKMMGGRMWVESEDGRGSTFHFTARLTLDSRRCEPAFGVA